MCRSQINRAALVLRQRHLAILGTLIVFVGCRSSEPRERQSEHPKPPSSHPSSKPSDAVEFRAEVVSVIPITRYSGTLRPVANDPRYAATVRLLDDVADWSCKQGETVCLGLHSPVLTFGTSDVVGRIFRFRIFGSARQYYRVETESDQEGDLTRETAQRASQVFHLPGMDVVRLADRLRSAITADKSAARDMIVVGDVETESIRVSGATTAQLRVIEKMIAEWRSVGIVDPYIEFIRLQHADARSVAKKVLEFMKTEGGFEDVTVTCDVRTNRLIVGGAGPERMRAIERFVADLDTQGARPLSGAERWGTDQRSRTR
jgi:hypothetical protein